MPGSDANLPQPPPPYGEYDNGPAPLLRRLEMYDFPDDEPLGLRRIHEALQTLLRQQEMATELIANILLAGQGGLDEDAMDLTPEEFRSHYQAEEDIHPATVKILKMIEDLDTPSFLNYQPPTFGQIDVVLRAYDQIVDRQSASMANHPSNRFRNRTD